MQLDSCSIKATDGCRTQSTVADDQRLAQRPCDMTGPTATWLWSELKQLGPPVICIDARHARAVLSVALNLLFNQDSRSTSSTCRGTKLHYPSPSVLT